MLLTVNGFALPFGTGNALPVLMPELSNLNVDKRYEVCSQFSRKSPAQAGHTRLSLRQFRRISASDEFAAPRFDVETSRNAVESTGLEPN